MIFRSDERRGRSSLRGNSSRPKLCRSQPVHPFRIAVNVEDLLPLEATTFSMTPHIPPARRQQKGISIQMRANTSTEGNPRGCCVTNGFFYVHISYHFGPQNATYQYWPPALDVSIYLYRFWEVEHPSFRRRRFTLYRISALLAPNIGLSRERFRMQQLFLRLAIRPLDSEPIEALQPGSAEEFD